MSEDRITVRMVYENILRELNKVNAPSLHLEDYNYFINRGITDYVNRRYNLYDTSQQTTDDLQVLTGSVSIDIASGSLGGTIGKGGYDDAQVSASIDGSNQLVVGAITEDVPQNVVAKVLQSSSVFNIDSIIDVPEGANQLTLLFVFAGTGTSFTITSTDRSVASEGDMVLLGGADSILAQAGTSYAGKSFKIENGIFIEIPFSGEAQKKAYTPVTTDRDGFPQVTVKLPENYYHALNCVVSFKTIAKFKCYPVGSVQPFTASRLTSDAYGAIMNNAFMKPDYRRPYFYVKNDVEAEAPSMDIRAGNYVDVFQMQSVRMDYLKKPMVVTLTTTQRDALADTSQFMEFPNYVSNEIVKLTTALIMENASDPRLQTHIPVNTSIPNQPPGTPQA